jgi:Kdo2-lipid IVA lauroyltransferase/acyltransferase
MTNLRLALSRVPAVRWVTLLLFRAAEAIGGVLVLLAILPVWLLPWQVAVGLGRAFGAAAYWLWPEGRRAGVINVRRAFGVAMPAAACRAAVHEVCAAMGASVAEGVQFTRRYRRGQAGWTKWYEAEDPALEADVLARPGPKIFVTAHLGSWEVGLMMVGLRMGPSGAAIMRRIDNPLLNAALERLRAPGGSRVIEKRGAVEHALAALQRGESVAMLLDENGGPRGPFVEFFGRPASTRKTAALLSVMTGAPIVVGAAIRRPGRPFLFRLAVLEPPASRSPRDVTPLTAEVTAVLERWIRETPWQWRWIHWRWRTRPDGTREEYTRAVEREVFAVSGGGTP